MMINSRKLQIINSICIPIFLILLVVSTSSGQTFGKNKVTKRQFEWLTYKTTHFTIYYYPDAERLVRTMADAAEIAYAKISGILEHDIKKNTPLILYKSHGDFQQTNVTLEAMGEGVGGFAELLKYRVVIPFTGSVEEFQKVLTHEITHIFEYDMLYHDIFSHIYTGEFLRSPPLWFLEGLAEYMADHWDARGEMVLRDAVTENSIVPLIYMQDFSYLGSRVYLGYKEGQSAVQFLAEKYGNDKLSELLRELGDSRSKDMNSALKEVIGITLEEFDKEWQQTLKEQYWPRVADKKNPDSFKTNLTKENDVSYYNIRPKWSPSGDLIAYITYQEGYEEIRIMSVKDGKLFSRTTKRLHGERYDSIREKGNGLAWSSDGDRIAFIGTKKAKDYLLTVNVVTGKVIDWIEMPFDSAYSPTWSPDNEYIGVVGLKDGRSDLYVFRLEDGLMTKLTSDAYDESSLAWHPSGPEVVYSSERNGRYKIFTINTNTGQIQQITHGQQNDMSPSWTPNGKQIVFCSDIDGIFNICTINSDGENFTRHTNVLTGCFSPVFSPDGNNIATTIYHNGRNDIYILNSEELLSEKISVPLQEEAEEPAYVIDDRSVRGVGYSLNFEPDIIYVDFGYLSGSGIQNTVQFVVSDIMGDHRLMAGVDFISFRNQPDFMLSYHYLKRRIDLGTSIFNWNDYHSEGEEDYWQRSTGIAGYMSYPLDRFKRADLQLGKYLRFLDYIGEDARSERKSINMIGLSFVNDEVIWSRFGPYSGMRYNLSLEQTAKFSDRDLRMTNVTMDLRRYLKLGQRTNLAIRVIGGASMGLDKDKFYLGGSFRQSQGGFSWVKSLMRGYDYDQIAGNRVGLLNLELRIPFIDELRFGWPFTWGLGGIRGVLFWDFGGVWPRPEGALDINGEPISYESQFKPWVRDEDGFRLMDLRSSIGAGFRIGLGMISLSFDFAKQTDLRSLSDGYKFHFGMGQEF